MSAEIAQELDERESQPVLADTVEAFQAIEANSLGPFIESQYKSGLGPDLIADSLNALHGIRIDAVVLHRWVSEEIHVREAIASNPLVRRFVEEHADELASKVPGDMGKLDAAINYLGDIVEGKDDDLDLIGPIERVRQRIKASRELGKMIETKYHLTGEPIVAKTRSKPAEQLQVIAMEVYGTATNKKGRLTDGRE